MLTYILLFLSGAVLWTFLEYALHSGLGHKPHLKNPFTVEHMQHHREVHHFGTVWKKALSAVIVVGGIALTLGLLIGWGKGIAFSAGLLLMYLVYEWAHSHLHNNAALNAYGAMLRRHHFYHHFNEMNKNHGVTTPFWDLVFGTYVKTTETIKVPKRTPLPWLINEQGELKEKYRGQYALV